MVHSALFARSGRFWQFREGFSYAVFYKKETPQTKVLISKQKKQDSYDNEASLKHVGKA
jgi:hypothetical protein